MTIRLISRRREFGGRASACAIAALVFGQGCSSAGEGGPEDATYQPTYEEFRSAVPRFENSYTVEGDIAIHSEQELREYYERRFSKPKEEPEAALPDDVASRADELVVRTKNGQWNLVPEPTRHNMTYCISNNFGTDKPAIVQAMHNAVREWEKTIRINFIYRSSEDGSCTSSNNNVYFNVRRVPGSPDPGFLARAFFPGDPRSEREILVNGGYIAQADRGTFIHELGHTLGFAHEFNHPDFSHVSSCVEGTNRAFPVPYDTESAMHYLKNAAGVCKGTATEEWITRLDRMAAQWLYGPPADRCSRAATDNCWTRDAYCESAYSVTGARSDLCRWPDVTTKSACEHPKRRGIWTTSSSGFAAQWPTAVEPGQSAACITQVNNLSCSASDAALCLKHGASCERAYSTSGQRKDLCRWYSANQSTCAAPGIWTTTSSGFAQVWPTAVGLWPPGATGACITQVDNLK